MSNTKEQNRALAAALRAAGVKDVRPMWDDAKAQLAAGVSMAKIAAGYAKPVEVQQPAAQYAAPAPRKQKASAPAFKELGRLPVTLSRGDSTRQGELVIGEPRQKLGKGKAGEGMTTPAQLVVDGASESCTLSNAALEKLTSKGTHLWFGGVSYNVAAR